MGGGRRRSRPFTIKHNSNFVCCSPNPPTPSHSFSHLLYTQLCQPPTFFPPSIYSNSILPFQHSSASHLSSTSNSSASCLPPVPSSTPVFLASSSQSREETSFQAPVHFMSTQYAAAHEMPSSGGLPIGGLRTGGEGAVETRNDDQQQMEQQHRAVSISGMREIGAKMDDWAGIGFFLFFRIIFGI